MSKTILIIMTKRQVNSHKNKKQKKYSTFNVPDSVDIPKTKSEKKARDLEIKQERLETDLSMYLDRIKGLTPKDLATINSPETYPNDKKKDRRYNRGVERATGELQLFQFLLMNLNTHYKNKILNSSQFNSLIEQYLGIADMTSVKLTREQREQSLNIASQMLVNALMVIKINMPPEFNTLLIESMNPFLSLVESLANFAKNNNIKTIPQLYIPDTLRRSN